MGQQSKPEPYPEAVLSDRPIVTDKITKISSEGSRSGGHCARTDTIIFFGLYVNNPVAPTAYSHVRTGRHQLLGAHAEYGLYFMLGLWKQQQPKIEIKKQHHRLKLWIIRTRNLVQLPYRLINVTGLAFPWFISILLSFRSGALQKDGLHEAF